MRQEILESLYRRRDQIKESLINEPIGGVDTPAAHEAMVDGVASLGTHAQIGDSLDDWSRDFGAMQAALDALRRAGVSEAALRNYFRRVYGDGSDGYSASSLAGLLGTDSPGGRVDPMALELLGMDPELVNQTRRAVRRNTTEPNWPR